MSPTRTVFLGSGGFGEPTLRALHAHPGVDLVGVVTAPPRPAGRKALPAQTPIAAAARGLDIPVLEPDRLRRPEALEAVLALAPELAVLADYGQLVPAPILALPRGALNLHPSLLPRHRGATPVPAAILAGDPETGVTLFRMDAGLDTGPIVAARRRALDGTEDAPQLEAALAADAAELLVGTLGPWIRGEADAQPQDEDAATLTRPLRRDDGRLDPALPAAALERAIRAYRPWPGTFVETASGRLVVLEGSVAPGEPGDLPGRIEAADDGLALATVDDRLVLATVQPAGGRPMTGAEFRRGHTGIVGQLTVGP